MKLLAVFILAGSAAFSQVTYDSSASTGTSVGSVTTTSYSHTVGSGSNRAIVIGVSMSTNNATGITVTVGGASATLVTGTDTAAATAYRTLIYCLAAPATGSQTVAVSWTTASDPVIGSVSFAGVDQSTPCQNGTKATGGSTPSTVTVTSAANNMTFVSMAGEDGASPTAATQTQRYNVRDSFTIGGAGQTAAGAATVASAWTTGSGWAISGIDVKAGAGSTVTPVKKGQIVF